MSKKQDAYYFNLFIACAEDSCKAAHLLKDTLMNFRPEELKEQMDRIHEIEHAADDKKHQMMDRVSKAFIVPIEREDIVALSQNIDEVTDKIEDVMIRLYTNNVQKIRPDAVELLDVVIRCCEEMKEMLTDFADFRHSRTLKDRIIRINAMEEEADRLYMSAMRKIHTGSKDPLIVISWREIYAYLESCADACEHVADAVESVVMKNS